MQSIFPLGFAPPWKSKIPQHKHGLCKKQKPNRSPAQRVRFGKEKQHHRSIGRRLRRRMTSWCCFDVVEARRVELLSENASKGTSPGADACFGIPHPCFPRHRPNVKTASRVASLCMARSKLCALTSASHRRPASGPRHSRRGRVTA